MQFGLREGSFDSSPTTLDALDRLLDRASEAVHCINFLDAASVEASKWFLGLRPHRQDLVRAQVHAASYPYFGKRVEVGKDLTLEAAAQLAFAPLRLLVENKANDGLLVEVALRTYGRPETIRLWDANPSTGKALDLVHGGGTGDLKKEIERLKEDAVKRALPARGVVVTDSDARWPGEISEKANQICDACAGTEIKCVILSCRSAENYIPDECLLRWCAAPNCSSAGPQVQALLRLSTTQRDHLRMKGKRSGLREVDERQALEQQIQLFSNIPAEDRALLLGFHDKIVRLLEEYLARPSPAELSRRDQRADLRRLVLVIESEL